VVPTGPEGRNTDSEKNPFHIEKNNNSEVNPHTGQIAISSEMTEMSPTTAPMGMSFGLYSSIDLMLNQYGSTKLV
jgi:hypothetical protein